MKGRGLRWGKDAEPIGCGSAAARRRRTAVEPGRPWAESGAEDAAGGDYRAKEFGIEKFGDEIGGGHGAPANEIEHAFFSE